jgi:LysM repeat protein
MMPKPLVLVLTLAACGLSEPAVRASQASQAEESFHADLERALSTTITTTVADTGVARPAEIVAVQVPEVQSPPLPPSAAYDLRRGESLAHFARWSGLSVEDIAVASTLDLEGHYPVGTVVVVPGEEPAQRALLDRRDEHHKRRAEAYMASRGGAAATTFVAVRTGDTAWSIAASLDAPVWLLETFNPSLDLDRLRPGQELMVPTLPGGAVADVDDGGTGDP